ncbi:MAG TPA: hypothetical protein DDZ51_18720, partial [Planctomycetaceae bacterium]|nr:hypothetical protein [Planctomycetaceae bacterium]
METVNHVLTTESQGSQRIAAALREASERLETYRRQTSEPLAIIGMACRFPGANTLDDFWQLLIAGKCSISEVPEDRWDAKRFHADQSKQPGRVTFNGGGFLSEIDRFDPKFFEITHREARSMDPQQRLMLEIASEALENAGVLPEQWFGRCGGVFAGICSSDYLLRLRSTGLESIDPYFSTGNAHGAAAGRLSYWLKWQGPSIAIDTACSSSLVAVHMAMQSLRSQECDIALAMGVNVILAPDLSISLSQAGMLSPSGISRTFASGADGFVRGEGCGAVLLKRLSDAQRDGDRIFCVLKGSAVNQDGRSNGLTAPNGPAQRDVIRQSLRRAAIQPDQIDYIEAHGTGTELGDPIEVGAINEVFTPRKSPLLLGSVKTNIGHLEGAAGIAGLIKTCLAMHHQVLPKHLHFEQPSPHIDWQPMVQVATEAMPWTRRVDHVRRAGVSSFGFGGTNAHVIVEETPLDAPNDSTPHHHKNLWLKVSAKTPDSLRNLATRYADAIEHGPLGGAELYELSVAANVGRSDWTHRAVVRYETADELIAGLREIAKRPNDGSAYQVDGDDALS